MSLQTFARPRANRRSATALRRGLVALLLGVAAATTLVPQQAKAWWNDEWSLRKKITLDTSSAGAAIADPIGTTPVLVRLHVGNFRFAAAKDDAGDLRFVSGDDKTPLKHHVEKFDSLLGEALVWVQVPNVGAGAKTDIWLYYGNKKGVSVSDVKATYDSDTLLTYHFSERGTPSQDSSPWGNHAQSAGQPAEGSIIGTGLRLDGRAGLTIPAAPSLSLAEGAPFTWSAWVKMAAAQPNAVIYSRRDGRNGLLIGLDNGAPFVEVINDGTASRSTAGAPIPANSWRHLALVATGTQMTLMLDGQQYAVLAANTRALAAIALLGADSARPAAPPAAVTTPASGEGASVPPEGASTIPAEAPASTPEAAPVTYVGFVGDIDEVQISKVARPLGFMKMQAVGQGPEVAKLVFYGVDEETASWLSGYFGVILRAVTIDGWVVIGILLVMAVISWVVMVEKASYLRKQARANERFLKNFREVAHDLTELDAGDPDEVASLGGRISASDAKMMRHASLYRIYHVGAAELQHRFARGERGLKAASFAAIRATLDASLVRETQRLNRLMVMLTIAISGGPFLGLLGTVVGVMITFGAIAASGDVNVNAIAPGIAAALVATVAGLAVAIPALFAYNYLTIGVRNLTADMQVFVDEFVTKMAEAYRTDADLASKPIAAE